RCTRSAAICTLGSGGVLRSWRSRRAIRLGLQPVPDEPPSCLVLMASWRRFRAPAGAVATVTMHTVHVENVLPIARRCERHGCRGGWEDEHPDTAQSHRERQGERTTTIKSERVRVASLRMKQRHLMIPRVPLSITSLRGPASSSEPASDEKRVSTAIPCTFPLILQTYRSRSEGIGEIAWVPLCILFNHEPNAPCHAGAGLVDTKGSPRAHLWFPKTDCCAPARPLDASLTRFTDAARARTDAARELPKGQRPTFMGSFTGPRPHCAIAAAMPASRSQPVGVQQETP